MRVAALEDNVAFLEQWCEEQQDALDRTAGAVAYDYEVEADADLPSRAVLRIVDLRETGGSVENDDEEDDSDAATIFALVDTEHDRTVRQIRLQLNRLRTRLAASLTPASDELPAERRRQPRIPAGKKLSAKPAGHTAP